MLTDETEATETRATETPATGIAAAGTGAAGQGRVARRQVHKFAERRAELAAAALRTLSEQGYARTSLRDIAQHSEFSHGVLHYYFADKTELITYCVRQYKSECVTRYDAIVAQAGSADQLKKGFAAAMAQTVREDAAMHRLWYDLRNQGLFDEAFRADVLDIDARIEGMIWRVVRRYGELSDVPLAVTSPEAYALMDGLFQFAMLRVIAGTPAAADDLDLRVQRTLESFLARE